MPSAARVSIKLTPAQRAELQALTGRSGAAIELDLTELDACIAASFVSLGPVEVGEQRSPPRVDGEWVTVK